jgi:hypothetical protein
MKMEQRQLPLEETPLERWTRMYQDGQISFHWLMRYLNQIADNRPRRLRNVADILRRVRDSKL